MLSNWKGTTCTKYNDHNVNPCNELTAIMTLDKAKYSTKGKLYSIFQKHFNRDNYCKISISWWRFISFISMITLMNKIKTENKMNINYLGNNKIKSPQTSQIRYQINFIPMKISASTVSLIYLLHKHGGWVGMVCLKKKTLLDLIRKLFQVLC